MIVTSNVSYIFRNMEGVPVTEEDKVTYMPFTRDTDPLMADVKDCTMVLAVERVAVIVSEAVTLCVNNRAVANDGVTVADPVID